MQQEDEAFTNLSEFFATHAFETYYLKFSS